MESEIKNFYKNKNIFLTGASGFLGKVIIEKLLRSTEVNRIYVLLRPKRNKGIVERLEDLAADALFSVLLKNKPNALERLVTISGDCCEPDLGISASDCELLKQHVDVVIHSAATLNFTEPLHLALDINTRATRFMVQLAKKMTHLEAFVYISTAFSNCVVTHITERFYPEHLECTVDKVLAMREMLDTKVLDHLAPGLLNKFPNTYTYTKALAEQVVQTEASDLPVCIFRPGLIAPTTKEPVAGWIDNIFSPFALFYGVCRGVIRVALMDLKSQSDIVPVDGCANLVLTCAWRTATQSRPKLQRPAEPTIFNFVPSGTNLVSYKDIAGFVEDKRNVFPLTQSIWYPFMHTTKHWWLYKLATIFYHLLPGYAMDLVLRLQGKMPKLMKVYEKIHKNMEVLHNFTVDNWTFETPNTDRLWTIMSAADKELFDFDIKSLDWSKYFDRALYGMRLYLAKEEPTEESFQIGRRKVMRFTILHRLLQFLLCCLGFYLLKCLLNIFL